MIQPLCAAVTRLCGIPAPITVILETLWAPSAQGNEGAPQPQGMASKHATCPGHVPALARGRRVDTLDENKLGIDARVPATTCSYRTAQTWPNRHEPLPT